MPDGWIFVIVYFYGGDIVLGEICGLMMVCVEQNWGLLRMLLLVLRWVMRGVFDGIYWLLLYYTGM